MTAAVDDDDVSALERDVVEREIHVKMLQYFIARRTLSRTVGPSVLCHIRRGEAGKRGQLDRSCDV